MNQRHQMQDGKCQKCGISERLWLDVPCMPPDADPQRTALADRTRCEMCPGIGHNMCCKTPRV
jgi:hypothetical protein